MRIQRFIANTPNSMVRTQYLSEPVFEPSLYVNTIIYVQKAKYINNVCTICRSISSYYANLMYFNPTISSKPLLNAIQIVK